MFLRKYLFIAALIPFSAAQAEIPLKNYRQFKDDPAVKDRMSNYVVGIYQGIFWANARLAALGKSQLICMPKNEIFDPKSIQPLLDKEIDSPANGNAYEDNTPIEFIVVRTLEEQFPCPDSRR